MIKILPKYSFSSDFYFGDEIKLRQVIANLLDNAVKYSNNGEVVELNIKGNNKYLTIEVLDKGIGITEDEIENIWNRLYRSTRSRNEPGLGLGLSMVRAIVIAHEGNVSVESQEGKGSVFTINLPLQNSNDEVIKTK